MSTNSIDTQQLKCIIEGLLLAAGEPLSLERIRNLLGDEERPATDVLRAALQELAADCETRGIELREVASGFCFQAKSDLVPWIKRLYQERPPRYSRAFLETLAVIVYHQPVTRAEIEEIRGVAVNANVIKNLLEREWIKVVGQKEVPGRPSLFATTKQFLDHFNLKSLEELPPLADLGEIIPGEGLSIEMPPEDLSVQEAETSTLVS